MKRSARRPPSPLAARRERIYLTGFMGSGKSTVGPILANAIGYEFADVDRAIERATGKSVNEIFRASGEEYFREVERRVVAELSGKPRYVVALGGGTLMDEENFRRITSSGIIVYLRSTPEHIFQRVRRRGDRPQLHDPEGNRLPDAGLRERIDDLYRLREPVYARADLIIHTGERRVGLTVDEIVRALMPHLD